jgi:predicted phage tail protein
MMRRVHFHGYLKALCPDPVEVFAISVEEAVEGVTRQVEALAPTPLRGRHRVQVVGCESVEALKTSDMTEIHVVPQFSGGKEGGFVQIVIGATLIAVSFALGGPVGASATWASVMAFTAGTSLVLGGVMQLLAPAPKRDQATGDPEASKYLGTPGNTVSSGTRVSVLYGRDLVYGHFLSFNINAKDVAV